MLRYFAAWLVKHNNGVHGLIPGVAFLFDCRLNDPNFPVELHRQKLSEPRYQRVFPHNDSYVKQTGQNFTIFDLRPKGRVKFLFRPAGRPGLEKEVRIQKVLGLKQR